jgi:ketosteroid isomerase-like protein
MSEENVKLVKQAFDRFAARDPVAWKEFMAEDIIWDTSASQMPGAGIYRGHVGVEQFFADWLAAWEKPTLEALELIDAEDSVVVVFRWRGRGKTSGVETAGEYVGVYDLRDGKAVRYHQYKTKAEALEAVGLGVSRRRGWMFWKRKRLASGR